MNAPGVVGLSASGRAVPVALLAALPGLVYAAGYDHLVYGLGLLAGVVIAAQMIAPRIAASGDGTVRSALTETFGPAVAGVAGVVLVAAALPLLAAEFAAAASFAGALGIAAPAAVPIALVLVLAVALVRDPRPLAWLSTLAWLLLALSLIAPLVLIAADVHGGWTVPHIAYGTLLPDLQRMEETLVERGLVDFDTFSAHAAPFIRLIERDVIALVVTLALGLAALPHIADALAIARRPVATRLAGAWATLFLMILLVSVPALAVYAKHAIYGVIAAGTPLTALPKWFEPPLASGLAEIHGTSLHLFAEVATAAQSGSRSASAVADALAGTVAGAQWQALDADVQQAMFAAVAHHAVDPASGSLWDVYLGTVLPAAAAAAGNLDGTLTQAGLAIEPMGLLFVVPGLTGMPSVTMGLIAVAVGGAGLAVGAAVVRSIARAFSASRPETRTASLGAGIAVAVAAIAAAVPMFVSVDPVALAVSALALAAAGLFPALALGLAWRRASKSAVIAAMLSGALVAGYYTVATQLYPAAFYETWPMLSDASEYTIEEFETLAEDARGAATEAEREAAVAAMKDLARGNPAQAGLANWGGIASPASAIFGVAAGLVVLILVSVLTPFRGRRHPQP